MKVTPKLDGDGTALCRLSAASESGDPAVSDLVAEMTRAWRRGERPLVEQYLRRYPEVAERSDAVVRLVYQEICLRRECGSVLSPREILGRFPQWQTELEILLGEQANSQLVVSFPEPGERWGDFQIVAELGRGAQGRVFLANQPELADRAVVLKVSACDGQEYLSLARLQHTHIVPLYWVQHDPGRNFRVLCMPYFGGATLAAVLDQLQDIPVENRRGRDLVAALDRLVAAWGLPAPAGLVPDGPQRQFLERASYVEAACWLGACLADALHYAHERSLVHFDLKPGNVLLATDGQPLLLDFHLAQPPLRPDGPIPEWLGGTLDYASPEHCKTLASLRGDGRVPMTVDGRSDIYALGVLLYEVLAGRLPVAVPVSGARLRHCNRHISVGLADIVCKCMAKEPGERFQQACDLAGDLRRHLAHQPLRGVPNRSPVERWRKWRRRRPHALALASMLALMLVTIGSLAALALGHYRERLGEAEAARADSANLLRDRAFDEAARSAQRGLSVAGTLPGAEALTRTLEQQLRAAQRGQATHDLHLLAERVRFHADADSLAHESRQSLERCCRAAWEQRHLVCSASSASSAEGAEGVRADLLDLAILGADLHVRLASAAEADQARCEAWQLLTEAEEWCGPSAGLAREQQRHAEGLGWREQAAEHGRRAAGLTPRTARDYELLGRALLRASQLEQAADALRRAADIQPRSFWAHFHLGTCAYRQQRYQEATAAFQVCIVLEPRAECYFNRALAQGALGQAELALRDYDRALELNPQLAPALLNRGILHARGQRFTLAARDFRDALKHGAEPAVVHAHQRTLPHAYQRTER